MAKVLMIDADEAIVHDVAHTLIANGLTVDFAHNGRNGLAKAMVGDFDVVTLDRVLPDIDGLAIVATMRGIGMKTPVVMTGAVAGVDLRVQGLRAGADDYLAKPFDSEEMSARIEVLLRRRPRIPETEAILRHGPFELDLLRRKATCRGREFVLQFGEWRVLEFMMRHPGKVLTRTMILEGIWGYHFDPGTNLIDVYVGRLRKKVGIAGEPRVIHTIRGSGYVFG
jgi:two-component system, OmpR family, response regulator